MAGKPEKGETEDRKESSANQRGLAVDKKSPPISDLEGKVNESDIKELSQEEISALISPVSDDDKSIRNDDIPQIEDVDPSDNQVHLNSERGVPYHTIIQDDLERSEPQNVVSDGGKPAIKMADAIHSDDIEPDTGPVETSPGIDREMSEKPSEINPSGYQIDQREQTSEGKEDGERSFNNNEVEGEDDAIRAVDKVESDGADDDTTTNESGSPGRQNRSNHLKVLGTILVGCFILVGYWGYILFRNHSQSPAPITRETLEVSSQRSPVAQPDQETNVTGAATASDPAPRSPLQESQNQLNNIRNDMLTRAEILTNLQEQYRTGVFQLKAEMIEKIRQSHIQSLNQALDEKNMGFQLHTIQRRLTYIDQLEKPIRWLIEGSEELLFLQRKHEIESVVLPICRKITTERLIAESDAAVRHYDNGALEAHLKVDLKSARYPELKQIWSDILRAGENPTTANTITHQGDRTRTLPGNVEFIRNNRAIWSEICAGQFERKHDLTSLSEQAAVCLAAWGEPDLFINRVVDLTPSAARNLLKWKGKWLGLNGLVELAPETASYLFKWEGDWISLNGLTFLNSESSAYLSKWSGKTLEMMGLSSDLMARDRLALKHLSAWMDKGNSLFVPDEIRELIEATEDTKG